MQLEGEEVVTETVKVPAGQTVPLDGIPIGTKVTITEETPKNQYIKSITVDGTSVDGDKACVNIGEDTTPGVQVVFTNTAHKPITIAVERHGRMPKVACLPTACRHRFGSNCSAAIRAVRMTRTGKMYRARQLH